MKVLIAVIVFTCLAIGTNAYEEDDDSDRPSYSYHKFRGPVSGRVRQVTYNDEPHGSDGPRVDYVAKPDYVYAYGVEDPKTGNSQAHKERRKDDAVIGEYRVLQPDGLVRIVKYTADGKSGFRATIEYEDAHKAEDDC